ncbi:MAG: hypothetical protein M9894_06685 [Planctomycetes bacterium]|nr:hypothetical protein [Planctomycetota bacterium]
MTDAPRPRPRGRLLALAPLLLLVAFVVASERAGRRRTLHVLNSTRFAAEVRVGDGPTLTVQPGARVEVPIAEGEHAARIDRGDGQPVDVPMTVRTPWLSRLTARPLFVLDVAGASPLLVEQAVYGDDDTRPVPPRLLSGRPFVALDHVDVAFAPFPREVESDRTVTRTRVDLVPGGAAEVLARLARTAPLAARLDWAELRLALDPRDEDLVAAYRALVASEADRARALAFLERGLATRPAPIVWHRCYQDLVRARGDEEALAARYEAFVAEAREDAGLLYLAGRLEPAPDVARARYEAALALDRDCAFAWHGLAFLALARGDAAEGARCAEEAARLRPDDPEVASVLHGARLADGRLDDLRADLEATLAARPLSLNALRPLLEVLWLQGREDDARARHEAFAAAAREHAPAQADALAALSAAALADLRADPDALQAAAARLPGERRASLLLAAHLARGDAQGAAALVEGTLPGEPRPALLVSVGFARAGDAEQARAWRLRAADALAGGTRRERRVGDLLRADRAPTQADLDRLALPPVEAAVLCAALAGAWPEAAAWLDERAARSCHGRYFPTWYLRR